MYRPVIIACTIFLCFAACRKDKDTTTPTPTGPVTQSEINNWILDSMKYFYIWNETLPATADTSLSAPNFFTTLKYKDDKFSLLYKIGDYFTYPKYMLYQSGIDFTIIASGDSALGVIKLVIPGSVADVQGIKRGDAFSAVDGTPVTTANATTLSENMLAASSFTLTMQSGSAITIPAQGLSENPIYLQDTFLVQNKVVGYLFYNYFNDSYNSALQQAFLSFKSAGVSDLILDLRYNPGGSVAAAAMLNAMIVPNISASTLFAKYKGNSHLGSYDITYESALAVPESGSAISFSSLSDKRLGLSRVFVLTGPGTTSAAELTLNTLKPYTQVIQIGETTYGKDKGAVIISDNLSPQRVPWTIMPLTYRLYNAKNVGEYTSGITPDYTIDEMSTQPLSPIGDHNDPLIAKAIAIISGNGRMANSAPAVKHYFDTRLKPAAMEVLICPR